MTERIALDLPDGRVLDVQVSGPTDGTLLVWHHGTPGCSYQGAKKQRALHERGVRFASYSRAGAAGSTRNKGRSVADVAADVAAIADHLGADTFFTGGQSGGGPHALATGALLPDRVLAVLSVCSVKPYVGQPDFLDGMGADNIEEFSLALQGETAVRPFIEEQRLGILEADAEGVIRTLDTLLPDVDKGSPHQRGRREDHPQPPGRRRGDLRLAGLRPRLHAGVGLRARLDPGADVPLAGQLPT